MLIVLAVLVIGLAAATTIARLTVTSALAQRADDQDQWLTAMTDAAHERTLDWLVTQSESVVLPPDAPTPSVHVADDAWEMNDTHFQITITAFDQAGMITWSWIQSEHPLPLPSSLLDRLQMIEMDDSPPGLDLLISPEQSDPFPVDDQSHAIGAKLATHADGTINVSTAPAWLLEFLESRDGIELPESIHSARQAGELPVIIAEVGQAESSVKLANQSRSWAFRIDLRAGLVARSWWIVYGKDRRGWERRQRLAIP